MSVLVPSVSVVGVRSTTALLLSPSSRMLAVPLSTRTTTRATTDRSTVPPNDRVCVTVDTALLLSDSPVVLDIEVPGRPVVVRVQP